MSAYGGRFPFALESMPIVLILLLRRCSSTWALPWVSRRVTPGISLLPTMLCCRLKNISQLSNEGPRPWRYFLTSIARGKKYSGSRLVNSRIRSNSMQYPLQSRKLTFTLRLYTSLNTPPSVFDNSKRSLAATSFEIGYCLLLASLPLIIGSGSAETAALAAPVTRCGYSVWLLGVATR